MAPRFLACFGLGGGSSTARRHTSGCASSNPAAAASGAATADLTAEEQSRMGPVLLELFCSQGCGTSPEAEAVAAALARTAPGDGDAPGVAVVVLAFHVDYWDYRGWKDPFGASLWTVRQKAYVESLRQDTIYTPQTVVHGRAAVLGTDQDALVSAVRAAPRFPSPAMQVGFRRLSPDKLQASFIGALRMKIDSADVYVALYENGLVTDCNAGENKGKLLPNDRVVRRMEKLLTVKDVAVKKSVSGSLQFALWEGFAAAKCGLVLFVQNSELQVLGVQQFALPENI